MKESSNHRLRILFLSSWYPSQEHRTLGNFVQRHAQAVAKLHDVSVIYATPYKKRGLPSDEINEIKTHSSRGQIALVKCIGLGAVSTE